MITPVKREKACSHNTAIKEHIKSISYRLSQFGCSNLGLLPNQGNFNTPFLSKKEDYGEYLLKISNFEVGFNNNNVAYITMRTFKKRIPPAENREQFKHNTFCYNFRTL